MLRATCSPFGSPSACVDKLIGNAYDTVKLVADQLPMLQYLVDNMESLVMIANDLSLTVTVMDTAGQPGQTISIPLPDGVEQDNVSAHSVLLDDGAGSLYGYESNMFSYYIQNGELKFTLSDTAPQELAGAIIRWTISHKV